MASVRAYIRTQSKNKEKVKVRFLLTDKKINLSYVSNLMVNPQFWDSAKQNYGHSRQLTDTLREGTNTSIQRIKYIILDIYHSTYHDGVLTSNLLSILVNDKLAQSPIRSTQDGLTQHITTKEAEKSTKSETSLLDAIDFTARHNEITYKRQQTYMVVRHALEKFIYAQRLSNRSFELTLDNTSINVLWDLEKFFSCEVDLLQLNPNIKTVFPQYIKPSIRSRNTVINFMRILRAVFNFCINHELTQNYPFKKFKMKEQIYGTPFYPTQDELKRLYAFQFNSPALCKQRDIFIFQCQVGMRINDLYQLSHSNINNDILEFIPSKSRHYRAKTVSIPLNSVAVEILHRYSGQSQILPFISQQKYNESLKKLFRLAGLNRPVSLLNPRTNKLEVKPLCEIIHSHAARKYFCANLFEQVKDQSIVAELSAHAPASTSFERYRNISNQLKKSLTDHLF